MDSDCIIEGKTYFSADISKYLYAGDENFVDTIALCQIRHGDKTIFSEVLYCNTKEHSLSFDAGCVIHAYMDANNISFAGFSITVKNPASMDIIDQTWFSVIFYRGHVSDFPDVFLKMHFLNDSEALFVPKHFECSLYLYDVDDSVNVSYFITLPGSEKRLVLGVETFCFNSDNPVREIKINIDNILQSAVGRGAINNNSPYPARLIISAGHRVMNFFIMPERPAFALAYRNGFNLVEYFWSFGSWKRKSSIKADTAFINRHPVAYGISGDDSFELVTHRMSARSMMHGFNFIGKTPVDVTLFLGRESFAFQGVLTEVDCDTDPFSDELTEIKMKATVSSNTGLMRINNSDMLNIFTNPFNISFQ